MDDDQIDARVAQLLGDAQAARASGDHALTVAFAKAALALRPEHPDALALLGRSSAGDADDGERRQLTVMFCDVVGSTQLSQRTDPEVVRSVLRGYRAVLDDVVTRVEGTIALWIGDGALVYFGHPVPHEDDAWRAVHAGMALLEGLGPVAAAAKDAHGIDLAVRVAVHTGEVIRAEMGTPSAPDRDAIVGSTPNLAARLQDKARPGSMVISGATYSLVQHRFAVVPVGPFELKGIDGLVGAYEVVEELPERQGPEALADGTPYIGRRSELDALLDAWADVAAGGTAVVAIKGDPGIGKTRLSAELRRQVVDGGSRALLGSCSAFHRATPLFPVRRVVESAALVGPGRPALDVVDRLRATLAEVGLEPSLPIVADLLGVAGDAGLPPVDLDPQRRREATLGTLLDWLAAEAARSPLLLVIDDLQWADPTTADLIERLVSRRAPGLLLVLTVRAGHPIPWGPSRAMTIELAPLADDEVRALVAELTSALDDELVASVVRRADGVPLFVEELVNSTRADGAGGGAGLPTSLRDPLLSRMAAAGDDLGLAQLVATIGDDVDVPFLALVTGREEGELAGSMKSLVAVGLLDADAGQATFRFHHHLMAELAYEIQLRGARQARHAAVADAIQRLALPGAQASLGRHLEHGGQPAAAIAAYVEAARAAQRRGSHPEAIATLDHAVELLPDVADVAARDRLELLALECRGFTTTSVLGLGAPQAAVDYRRCLELLLDVPDISQHEFTMISVYSYFSSHADLDIATDLNDAFRAMLVKHGRDEVEADSGNCLLSFLRGDFRAALRESGDFSRSALGRLDLPVPDGYPLPNEPVCSVRGVLAACQALDLDLAGAEVTTEEIRRRAAALPFPFGPQSAVSGLSMASMGWWYLHDVDRTQRCYDDVRALADQHGTMAFELVSNIQAALHACWFGDPSSTPHAAMLVEVWKATGVLMLVPCYGSAVVEGHRRLGDFAAAITAADEHLAFAEATGLHVVDAVFLRLRGLSRLAADDAGGADDLRAAAALAAEQGARLFQLQALLALAALDDADGRAALADLVATIPAEPSFVALDEARALLGADA